ncbi:MAG: hypothetical protein ACXVLQ_17455 [Bacteriovorax sp.]
MKLTLIFLSMLFVGQVGAAEKDETQIIAKGIQCTYLREKSYLDIYELYSVEKMKEKANLEYIKKVSDSIYAQAFKICDPENIVNADKEILTVCTTGCDQFVSKSVLGLGGSSVSDIEACKKMCLDYSDHLSNNYTGASKALKKYIAMNPPSPKKSEQQESPAPSAPAVTAPSAAAEKEAK